MQTNDANTETQANYTAPADAAVWLTEFSEHLAASLTAGARVQARSLIGEDGQPTFTAMFSLTPTSSVETVKEDGTTARPLLYFVGRDDGSNKRHASVGGKTPLLIHPATPQSGLAAVVLKALTDVAWPRVSEPATNKDGSVKVDGNGLPQLRWKQQKGQTEFLTAATLKGRAKEVPTFDRGSVADALITAALEKVGPPPVLDLRLWQVAAPKGEDPYKTIMCSGDLERSTKVRHRTYKTTYPQDFVATVDREGNHVPATFYTKRNGKYLNGCCPECGEPFMVAPTKAAKEAAKAQAKATETAQLAAEAPPKAA